MKVNWQISVLTGHLGNGIITCTRQIWSQTHVLVPSFFTVSFSEATKCQNINYEGGV